MKAFCTVFSLSVVLFIMHGIVYYAWCCLLCIALFIMHGIVYYAWCCSLSMFLFIMYGIVLYSWYCSFCIVVQKHCLFVCLSCKALFIFVIFFTVFGIVSILN